ncbi:GTPase HflX [Clostridium sp. MB40-C1]|uniref:GTPase HflX n=1 Tax=Clostridium sp. MB40-C1 TaxID=3070996 RepID=UPI0027DF5267|nr:GTPase HflX [Clostridium sp. MB40-C1]WMJ81208.1 GTPase HflX [Clostridium sp. MB40-C1]
MITGNTEGIRKSIINRLEDIYECKTDKYSFFEEELINTICEITEDINKEVSVAIDRRGNVVNISIGDSSTVEMPLINIRERKLSGIRIIHTHPNGNSMLSNLDISALIKLKLDFIAAIGVENGKCTGVTLGFCGIENNKLKAEIMGPLSKRDALNVDVLDIVNISEENIKLNEIEEDNREKAILIGIENEESLDELEELAKACDVITLDKVLQKRDKGDTAFFIGEGKANEISMLRQALNANVIIFDDELTASQIRNLESLIGVKIIDRTTLILEIFARRARSKEAKIQVELAQLKYRLPRLTGLGVLLSRTGGGIGTKGPGEKKLEMDKRHIRDRIHDLTVQLKKIKKIREVQREKRSKENIPKISLVGYTNAGKSTLRNKLCEISSPKDIAEKEKVFEADMLFATLDVTTRALMLKDNRLVTLTDTVGFVRKLPHDLVEAFKSTLEEVINSELLLHIVDSSSDTANKQIEAVNEVLKELGVEDKPIILVLNKVDKADEKFLEELREKYNELNPIEISAKQEINLDLLFDKISNSLPNPLKKIEYLIPYTEQGVVALLHRGANVLEEEYKEDGTYIEAMVDQEVYNRCEKYILTEDE